MKAVIMAGGEGTRLRPISANRPKPMVRLFDKPVLEHILKLLHKNGIDASCLTLRYMPQAITDYFGDGKQLGLCIQSRIEQKPLGTAGSVRACKDFIGDESFLIISGDCVCDFDLRACIDFHKQQGADATIVLYAHPEPTEYGLVLTAPDGRVQRFMEKPAGDSVFTDLINTGIYILSPSVLDLIPENESYDFGKDLFPRMVREKKLVYGVRAEGYWCDIGAPAAYLQCAMDVLDGKCDLGLDIISNNGIRSAISIPAGVQIEAPSYIGAGTVLEPGCTIGPHAVLGRDSAVSAGAVITRSVSDGVQIGEGVQMTGTVALRGSVIREGCIIQEGAVIGEGTLVGAGSQIQERVRVWPGKELPPASIVRENIITGQPRSGLHFSGGGVITGEAATEITPEACIAIGSAAGEAGNRVGIGFSGGHAARAAELALISGICSAGGCATEIDGRFAASFSFALKLYGLPWGIFVEESGGRLTLRFFGRHGLRLTREGERKIEAALSSGDYKRANASGIGDVRYTTGILDAYLTAAEGWGDLGGHGSAKISVTGTGGPIRALKSVLETMGADIVHERLGTAAFSLRAGGLILQAEDEEGRTLDDGSLLTILALIEFETGIRRIAVPYTAPLALDILAKEYDARVLRLGRDPGAEDLYSSQPQLRDGVFAAARLLGYMRLRGETLSSLSHRIPSFKTAHREVPVSSARASVMRELSASCAEFSTELISGIRADLGSGWVHIAPSATRPVIKITGESADMEAAEELCLTVQQWAQEIDRNLDTARSEEAPPL